MMDETIPALSIGSIVGGRSRSTARWREAITKLTGEVAAAARDVDSLLNVNVIFQVPGNILKPDFDGVRTGYFSKKESSLIVQAALPEDAPDDVDDYLKRMLDAAVDEAERWAQRRRLAPDLRPLHEVLSSL